MNECASDEESAEDKSEFPTLAKEEIARSNISKRVSQIIIPLDGLRETKAVPAATEPASVFRSTVIELQARAREELGEARDRASTRMVDIVNTRKKYHNNNILHLLGLSRESKVRLERK